jgi:LuxR family transcriptional regulator, maltose regulon positive regulatory protein
VARSFVLGVTKHPLTVAAGASAGLVAGDGRGGVGDGGLVLASKLVPPGGRRGVVVRQGLVDLLAGEVPVRLVLVVAPAGWGKTSLLREWFAGGGGRGAAWLSVDGGDNDPVRFWAGVIAAVSGVCPGAGGSALRALRAGGVRAGGAVLGAVINDLAGMAGRVTLVLDDFHLITNPAIRECFAFLVEHLPPTLGLVVAARSDPELPLARLRGRGEMAEIGADELRFSEAEAAELLNGTLGLALPPEDVRVLQQRTEGWVGGLCLAGLSLRGGEDRGGLVRGFAGDDRRIVDYFAAEVLDGLAGRVRSHLVRTSVLGRFCGPLCDAVTGAEGSQLLLEELERSQLFLVPLDATRRWYRYHRLFAELLRHELDRSEPGLAPLLHRRASAWHRQHGSAGEAIDHAVLAGDLADARELIAARCYPLIGQGLADQVDSWLDRLPPEMVVEDARTCLARGFAACQLGRLDEVEPWLAAARAAAPQGPFTDGPASVESGVSALQAGYRHLVGDLAGEAAAGRRAAELEAAGTAQWRAEAVAAMGANLFWRGQDAEAGRVLGQMTAPTRLPAGSRAGVRALGYLSAISARGGDPESCQRHLDKAASLAARYGLGGQWITAVAGVTSADLLAGRGQLAEAEAAALGALELAQRGQARLETAYALLCLAKISSRAGKPDDARARLSQAAQLTGQCADPGILTGLLAETGDLAGQRPPAARPAVPGPRPPVPGPRPAGPRPASPRPAGPGSRPGSLTSRETQVLELLAAGHTNHEIAATLVVSIHTIERHLQNAYRKIGVRNRADAAAYIVRSQTDDDHEHLLERRGALMAPVQDSGLSSPAERCTLAVPRFRRGDRSDQAFELLHGACAPAVQRTGHPEDGRSQGCRNARPPVESWYELDDATRQTDGSACPMLTNAHEFTKHARPRRVI